MARERGCAAANPQKCSKERFTAAARVPAGSSDHSKNAPKCDSFKKRARSAAATSRRTSPRFLPECENLREHRLRLLQPRAAVQAHRLTRQQCQNNAARQLSRTSRIFGQRQFQPPQNCVDRLAAFLSRLQSRANFAQPDFTERIQQLFLAREIIEKGPLSYIGGLR